MANYIAVEFKPFYIPFDYSFPPYKEYIPPVQPASVSPLRGRAPEFLEKQEAFFKQER